MSKEIKTGQIIEYDKDNTPHFIIDGVDVSGCIYKKDDIFDCGMPACRGYKCEGQICLYKQMKRLEAENQELGKIIDCKNGTIASLAELRDELKQENAKLKEALEEIKKISKKAFAVCDDDCGNANKFMDIINKVSEVLKDE